MLVPIGRPTLLRAGLCTCPSTDDQQNSRIICISCNRERLLFAILTAKDVSIFWSNPQIMLLKYGRPETSRENYGENLWLLWKPDSSSLVISTSKNYLLFYKLEFTFDFDSYQIENNLSALPNLKFLPGPIVKISAAISW
uniref:Uncharacterized protein n=1 Tax=Romanomermis culicivorax TaxID=13658 RepID=A0A915KZA7_ROMCU